MSLRKLAILCLFLLGAGPVMAGDKVMHPAGSVIVPEHFLRQWDPVTIFFDSAAGPAAGGPEDHPEKFVTLSPSHPGAFTWLDGRTLQFRPATAWAPMAHSSWTVGGRKVELATLMSAPLSSQPADGAADLDPVESIALYFRDPIDGGDLAKLLTLELRPLPGINGDKARTLDSHDFDIRTLERRQLSDPAGYVVLLHHPVSWGTKAILHIRLSPDSAHGSEEQKIAFSTAEPFHVAKFGCRDTAYPALPGGVSYSRERALTCPADDRSAVITFSSPLAGIGPIEARNLVRLSPQVEGVMPKVVGNTLVVEGRFAADTLYQLRLEPAALKDAKGRPLALTAASELYLSFPSRPGFVNWKKTDGIAERFGPQMVPVSARGVERVDLRIHPIDPLDRSLWPFPENGVKLDETDRPPAPGEQPQPWTLPSDPGGNVANYIRAFGSPSFSELVTLPLSKGDTTTSFGLDLREPLAHIAGAGKPGHYLIGIRRLDAAPTRQWMRLQVTDLSLTAIEETDHVRFAVTSLSTGQPIAGAKIRLEAVSGRDWKEVGSGVSGTDGFIDWQAPGSPGLKFPAGMMRRVVVSKDDDILVLDTHHPPRQYAEGGWREDDRFGNERWLDWTLRDLDQRGEPDRELCHIFTERPIYRPDDAVHIKGYVRHYEAGLLSIAPASGTLVVEGPGGAEWRWPLELNQYSSFYHKFDDTTLATGTYKAYLEIKGGEAPRPAARENDSDDNDENNQNNDEQAAEQSSPYCHFVRFKKEAHRLPKFEVQLQTPLNSGLDAPFSVGLTTEYYAGGVVNDRPLHWRVTQLPFTWMPKARPGFVFSADQRFSGNQTFRSSPVLERDDKTDEHGAARIAIDPTIEPTAQPRKYVIEATVTGDDDQTVTNTQEVLALPPFVLGLKVPRFIEHADKIEPQILVEDSRGAPLSGQKVTVRLLRRQWNSILQASDFTQGSAKYVTEVIEDKIGETTIVSGADPVKVSFPVKGAAVYVVEVESQDKLGRLQTVKEDLFAGGERPATWSRPPAEIFSAAPDKNAYAPGETAKLVLQSPFQNGRALAVIEEPDGHNVYQWVTVSNGYATFAMPVKPEYMPRIAVHFVLMRGRLKGDDSQISAHADLRKPATLAATQWVTVTPVKNIVKVDLTYPRKATPAQDIDLTVKLADDQGKPLSGEVTLWMVDQAVLALAPEAKLDPLPQFIVPRHSSMTLRDSRNMAFGLLPLQEEPGGDEGDEGGPLMRSTVRKNFTPVPYYEPNLIVGPSGEATVKVKLPDSLTNFKLRAKAVSGPSRFGFGTGDMQVRLPLIVQPALPRFVRPGDSFELSAIGRVVEGEGGKGRAQVKLSGLDLTGPAEQSVDWQVGKAQRLDFPVKVPTPTDKKDSVEVTMAIERTGDGARDAFQVTLPILPDRDPIVTRTIAELAADKPLAIPALTEAVRPGSLKRDVLIASRELAALAGGLDYLRRYPFGCAEQRISQTRADVAALGFGQAIAGEVDRAHTERSLQATEAWITSAMDGNGLVAYWPGSRGYVTVTAWALQMLVEANAAGFTVEIPLREKLVQALRQSLRSNYAYFIDGESWSERTWALTALTMAGQGDPAYAAELARKAQFLHVESQAQVAWALAKSGSAPPAVLADLQKTLWQGVITRLDHGKEVYGGLQENGRPGAMILPSESRSLAQILRATQAAAPAEQRNRLLSDALLRLGQGDGWGSTNANAEALLALTETMAAGKGQAGRAVTVTQGGNPHTLDLAGAVPASAMALAAGAADIALTGPSDQPLSVLLRSSYLPQADGSAAAAAAQGFAVDREQAVIGPAARRVALDKPGNHVELGVGEVVEDHVTVTNSADRTHIAIVVPLAAGMEPLNPNLATAPPEAKPSEPLSLAPSYVAFLDDRVMYFYDELPKGIYHFRLRTRATVPGRFIQPPAAARAMYDDAVNGNGNGALVVVTRP